MKTLIAALILFSSVTAMASKVPCKIEAHTAAANLYSTENPGTSFYLKTKYKPILENVIVYHTVEILETEGGRVSQMTVSLNPKTCGLLSID
jgi:hypothetical protein